MFRYVAAVAVAAHGVVHLIGFVVPWRLADVEGFVYRTTVLAGQFEVGADGARLIGLLWLVAAGAFVVAAIGLWREAAWVVPVVGVAALVSLGLSVLGLPEAAAGIGVNLAILAAVSSLALNRPRGRLRAR